MSNDTEDTWKILGEATAELLAKTAQMAKKAVPAYSGTRIQNSTGKVPAVPSRKRPARGAQDGVDAQHSRWPVTAARLGGVKRATSSGFKAVNDNFDGQIWRGIAFVAGTDADCPSSRTDDSTGSTDRANVTLYAGKW